MSTQKGGLLSVGDLSVSFEDITGDPADNTDLVTYLDDNFLKIDGSSTMEGDLELISRPKLNDKYIDDRRFFVKKYSNLYVFGDSISDGAVVGAGFGYVDIFIKTLDLTLYNYSAISRGVYRALEAAYQYIMPISYHPIFWMAGFNDLRRSADAKTYLKIKNSLRAFLANAFMKTVTPANNGSVTQTGTWTTLIDGVIGDKSGYIPGGTALYSSNVSATLEFSFTGTSLVIGTWATDGVTEKGGIIEVEIDGEVVETWNSDGQTDGVSDSVYDNTRTPTARVYRNLSNTSHTVIVTVLSLSAGGNIYIDYFGTLKNPSEATSVFVFDIPKMNSSGYAEIPNQASDAVFNAGDEAQIEIIEEFYGYPVARVYTNDYYDIVTGLSIDNIHPNEIGYQQIAEASLNLINQEFSTSPDILDSITQVTSKSTTVIINQFKGTIITHDESMLTSDIIIFTVTNALIKSNNNVVINHSSGGTFGSYSIQTGNISDGSFKVSIQNISAGSLGEVLTLNFVII